MAPTCKTPAGVILAGASRDCFGGWSRFADTLTMALVQPPALPRLIALHLGAEVLAGISLPMLEADL